jgi:hypothetical protein
MAQAHGTCFSHCVRKTDQRVRFLRCCIWIIFRVSSPSWRQYCLRENPGSGSLSQLSTAWSSVPSDCERHSLALFRQTCFVSAYTGSACGRGSRNKHTPIEIRRSDRIVVGRGRPSDEPCYAASYRCRYSQRRRPRLKPKCREPLSDGPELPNGVFILTTTPFARCLHHVISFEPPYRSNKNRDHKENREKTPFEGSRTRASEWQYLMPKRRKQRFETQVPTTRFCLAHDR